MRPIRPISLLAAALLFFTSPSHAQSPQGRSPRDLLVRAAESMGGEAALRGLQDVSTRFVSTTFGIGQEETWASPPRATIVNGSLVMDHARGRRLLTQEIRPAASPSGATQVRQLVTAEYGATETNGAWQPMAGPALGAVRRAMRDQPERLVLFALDNSGAVRALPARTWREETLDGVRIVNGADAAALYFDRITGRPALMVVVTDDPVLGDRVTETAFTRWTPTGAVRLPRQVDSYANGRQLSTTVVSSGETNGTIDEAMFGLDGALVTRARAAAATVAAPVSVSLVSFGPGVWRAEGGTHHSLVVEQGDGLLVIEAPQSADRSRAVLDTLARHFPGRTVRQVVNTHHHYDHSGGVRGYLARGIPMLTHGRNVAFVTRIAGASKTIAPDALSRGGRIPAIRAVSDTMVIGSGASMFVVYPIPSIHAEGLLAVFVPSAGVLFTSDVLNPPVTPTPAAVLNPVGAAELVAFAKARGLAVTTYAGGHGAALPWADVERAVPR